MAEDTGILEHYRVVEYELGVLSRRMRTISVRLASEVHPELDPGGYALMVRIEEVGPVRPSDLAEYFGIGKPTMGRQLKSLETLGLIGREPDPADGRAHLFALTEEGSARLGRVRDGRQQRMRQVLETWETDDVRTLALMLGRLNSLAEGMSTGNVPTSR